MRTQPFRTLGLALGTLTLACACDVQARQDTPSPPQEGRPGVGEKVGQALDRTARVVMRRARSARADVEAAYNRAKTEIANFGVEARITGRLQWDKHLQGSHVEIEVDEQGVATLRGRVPDAAAKAKAVALTRDTIGVREVVDELEVEAPPSDAGQPKS